MEGHFASLIIWMASRSISSATLRSDSVSVKDAKRAVGLIIPHFSLSPVGINRDPTWKSDIQVHVIV